MTPHRPVEWERMIQEHLKGRGIKDRRVLDAMNRVDRREFVSEEDHLNAFDDRPLFIGEGQTISQPYIVALMTELLGLKGDEKVLEIGTGSGYQTAILSLLGGEVWTIERLDLLSTLAQLRLERLGYSNIHFKVGDGTLGWPEAGPFDAIIVTAAAPQLPPPLVEQIIAAGRMVIPVGSRHSQELWLVEKDIKDKIRVQVKGGCLFVPLVGKAGWAETND